MEERVQKILAKAGYGSRRACEKMVAEGRVKINGKIAILGSKADISKDKIELDEKIISRKMPKLVYIMLNKPKRVLSDLNPSDNRKNVRDLVPDSQNLFPVGRLDYYSEGLILLTNDGDLANKLTHPRFGHEKEYRVLVNKKPDQEQLSIWRRGVVLEDGYRTAPAQVFIENPAGGDKTWLKVIMKEGKKRQIREVCSRIGLPLSRIIRVRIGPLTLGKLKPRTWRHLTPSEVEKLKTSVSSKKSNKK